MNDAEDRIELVVLAWLWSLQGKAPTAAATKSVTQLLPAPPQQRLTETLGRLTNSTAIQQLPAKSKRAKPGYKLTEESERRIASALSQNSLSDSIPKFADIVERHLSALAVGLPPPANDRKSKSEFAKLLPPAAVMRHYDLPVAMDKGLGALQVSLVKLALARIHHVSTDNIHLKSLPKTNDLPAWIVSPLLGVHGLAFSDLDSLLKSKVQELLGTSTPKQIKVEIIKRWLEAGGTRKSGEVKGAETVLRVSEPDGPTFAGQVAAAARAVAENGGDGVSNLGDKVLVRHVWQRYQQMFGLSPLDRFKRRLSEMNGQDVILVREDLIPFDRRDAFAESEVKTGASSYHYVRIARSGVAHAAE